MWEGMKQFLRHNLVWYSTVSMVKRSLVESIFDASGLYFTGLKLGGKQFSLKLDKTVLANLFYPKSNAVGVAFIALQI